MRQARPWLIAAGSLPLLVGLGWALRDVAVSAWGSVHEAAGRTRETASAWLPRTPAAWGGLLLAAAFALLGVGAWRARRANPRTAGPSG